MTMSSPGKTGECSQSEKPNVSIKNALEDDDVVIIDTPEEESIPVIELGDDNEIEDKKKLDAIISHVGHKVKTIHRKLICDDCDTRVCPSCYKNFPNHLKHHIYHNNPKSHICTICDVSFRTTCALKAHENLHKIVFPLVCPDCGAIYQQKKYFINHCLDRCSHLFKQARYMCSVCDCVFERKLDHENHMKEHVITKYYCRMCGTDLGTSKKEALAHVKEKHDIILTAKTATFGLDANTFCDICHLLTPHDHYKFHLDSAPKTFYVCSCGINCPPHLLRVHRNSCCVGRNLPKYWKDILSLYAQKSNDKVENTQCTECEDASCEECTDRLKKSFRKCLNCNRKRKTDELTNICGKCETSLNKTICEICACRFKKKDNQEICNACIDKQKIESNWLGAHTIIGAERDLFETCELTYDKNPPDHQYCLRQDFVSKLEEAEESRYKDLLVNSSNNDFTQIKRNSISNSNTIMCYLCSQELRSPGNSLYKLLLHVKKYHTNAVIPTAIPSKSKSTDIDELDLMSRVKILEENKQNSTEEVQRDIDNTPRKRMRLYDPKSYKKDKTALVNDSNIKDQKENNAENVSNDENQTPPKKDYEFWDEVYEALSMVNKRDIPKSKKDVVYENLSGYSSKRQVKKPMRLVEQEEDKQQSLSRKTRSENDIGLTTPEKSTDESDSIVLEKKKRSRGFEEIDPELAKVKHKLKTDNELGFLAKTFKENTKQTPNKRKRKLASKLVYNEVIDALNNKRNEECTNGSGYQCDICKVVVGNRQEFKQHWLTHRDEESPQKVLNGRSVLKRHHESPVLQDPLGKLYMVRGGKNNVTENEKSKTIKNDHDNDGDKFINDIGHKCKVCYQSFPTALDLNKHFRIHGLAFLKQAQKDIKSA